MRIHRALLVPSLVTLSAMFLISAQSTPPRLDRALDAQRALAEKHPSDAGVQNDLGNLLELAGDRLGAEQAYLHAIELAPEDPGPRFNYGLLLVSTNRRRQALSQFREVVELDPGHAWAHYQIGAIWDAWGLDRMARRSYARAFELDFQLADPRVNPDVLDNREATAAMLLAWKRGTPAAGAPRDYSDAGRIASLLIEVPEPEPGSEPEQEAGEGGSGGGFARLANPPLDAPGWDTGGEAAKGGWQDEGASRARSEAEPKVLDSSDLREAGRSVNQISAPGGAPPVRPRTTTGSRGSRSTLRRPPFGSRAGSTGRLEPALRPVDDRAQVIAG